MRASKQPPASPVPIPVRRSPGRRTAGIVRSTLALALLLVTVLAILVLVLAVAVLPFVFVPVFSALVFFFVFVLVLALAAFVLPGFRGGWACGKRNGHD